MNTIDSNVSFGAKLDCSKIIGNKARWTKIAEVFEEKTRQYPYDFFRLKTNDEGGIYFFPKYFKNKKANGYDGGEISKDTANILSTFSSEKVADILKRIFNIRKKADSMITDYYKFEDKYNLTEVKYDKFDDFFMKFIELRKAFIKDKINEDKLLKDLKGIDVV